MIKITVLVENNSRIDNYLLAEPALSVLLEVENKNILFDTGYSDVFLKNAEKLNVDLSKVSDVVISHGHNDHTRGLSFWNLKNKNINLIAHPNIFDEKIGEDKIHYGCPVSKEQLEENFNVILTGKPYFLTENICFLGQIKNNNSCDIDDSALVYKTADGLIIITGCSHSGIINIINYAKKVIGINKIFAIFGGFHLVNKTDDEIEAIADFLQNENIKYLYPCHCCNLNSKIILAKYCDIKEVCTGDVICL